MSKSYQRLLAAACVLAFAGVSTPVAAEVILADAFTGSSTSAGALITDPDIASFAAWDTVSGINAPSSTLVFVGNGEDNPAADLLFHGTANEIAVDYNLSNEGSWFTTIEDVTLAAGVASISLTDLSLSLNATSNNGGNQGVGRNLQLTAEVIGLGGAVGSTDSQTEVAGGTRTAYNSDLSGITLVAGQTYDLKITISSNFTSGVNASIDDLVLNGDITLVPEPGSLALLGLGGLMMMKRRRR